MALCENKSFCLGNNSHGASVEESEMTLTEILKLTLEVLIALIGVVGNILVVIVINHLGKKKRPWDCYVQNLALADLGTLLIAFPIVVIRLKMSSNWPFGGFACLYFYPVVEIFFGASVWCIVVIAIERYQRVVSMKILNRNRTSLQRAKTIAASVWAISFLTLCLPLYFVVDYRHDLPNGGKFCGLVKWTQLIATVYTICLTLLTYVLPLAIISFTYIAISHVLRQSINLIRPRKQEHNFATPQSDKRDHLNHVKCARLRQIIRAKKILSPLVVTFAVTMLPLNVFRLAVVFWPALSKQEYYAHLLYAVVVATIINSCANPVIYSVVSREFRKEILNNFCCIS